MNYEQKPEYMQPYNIRCFDTEEETLREHLKIKEHRRQKYEIKDEGNKE
jgi:hypothetical protein